MTRRTGLRAAAIRNAVCLALLIAGTSAVAAASPDEAKRAVDRAAAAVKSAADHKALWTTAQSALEEAQKAAKAGDNDAAVKHAKLAEELSKLGIAQTRYPLIQ